MALADRVKPYIIHNRILRELIPKIKESKLLFGKYS